MTSVGELLGKTINRVNKLEETPAKKGEVVTQFTINWFKVKAKNTNVLIETMDDTGRSVVGETELAAVPWLVGDGTTLSGQNLLTNTTNKLKIWELEPTSVDFVTTNPLSIDLYIKDQATLDKIQADGVFTSVTIRVGKDSGNFYEWSVARSLFVVGEDTLTTSGNIEDLTVVNSPGTTNLDYVRITITTNNATDTFSAGDIVYGKLYNGATVYDDGTNTLTGANGGADTTTFTSASWSTHEEITTDYMVTNTARTAIAKYLNNESPNAPSHIAWGDDSGKFLPSNKNLYGEQRRISATNTAGSTGVFTSQSEFYPIGETGTLREVGMFDSSSAGDMWARNVITSLDISENLRVRVTFTITYTDQTGTPSSSIITNYGLNHFRDYVTESTSVFDYTEWSDGTTAIDVSDTSLDGSNTERNQISTTRRDSFKVEKVTILATTEFNTYSMLKIGNYVLSTGDNLVTETELPTQVKQSTFKVRNTDIFEVVTDYVPSGSVFPMTFPFTFA